MSFQRETVAVSLRRQALWLKASRKFSPVSYREHGLPVSENLLKQDFYTSGPNQKWSGDITYLRTDEGWLYPGSGNKTSLVISNGNDQIGSITKLATSTSFNTTSDERLKDTHAKVKNVLAVIQELVGTGVVQIASFKTELDKITPMSLAQRTGKIIPEMVAALY